MTIEAALEYLYSLSAFGVRPGLETTQALAKLAGHPQEKLRFIHVAGTNGKGSVCATLESIYRSASLRVGLYTSPHLIRLGERIQVNRELIPDSEIVRLVGQLRPLIQTHTPALQPTLFEFTTIIALCWFVEQNCDLVIWETGLGGRFDSTNIVLPLASVITNIGWDHQQWLGDTLSKIATEKAGIIKPGVPVITASQVPEARGIIHERARHLHSPIVQVEAADAMACRNRSALEGAYQAWNTATALAVVHTLHSVLPISAAQIESGLHTVSWPGRFQRLRSGDRVWIIDGAHNTPGIQALVESCRIEFIGQRVTWIVGMLGDKDCREMCEVLATIAGRFIFAPVKSNRAATPQQLGEIVSAAHPSIQNVTATSVREALGLAGDDPRVVVTGSLYFVGEVLDELEGGSTSILGRGLN